MCFLKLGQVNYSCHFFFFTILYNICKFSIIFISLRDNVLLITKHLSQLSLAVNMGTKGRSNHTALKNNEKNTDFSNF